MITFYCKKCGAYLGEMTKGRLKKDSVLYCTTCQKQLDARRIAEDLEKMSAPRSKDNVDTFLSSLFSQAGRN